MNYIRRAQNKDQDKIMEVIHEATEFLRQQGSPQWQNGYGPTLEMILDDIANEVGYVLIHERQVCGYAALISGVDDCYTRITQGSWKETDEEYVSIHRVAMGKAAQGKGLAGPFMHDLMTAGSLRGYNDLRIDTYPRNLIMERVILKAGFLYCGMVEFPIPDGERKAYQLVLN